MAKSTKTTETPEETLTEQLDAAVEADIEEAVEEAEEKSLWQQERDKHGWESMVQLFGHLSADAKMTDPGDGKFPYVTARIAVNRGENMDASFITCYIRGVKESSSANDNTRPDASEMETLASLLKRGDRIKVQGKLDVRPARQDLYKQLLKRLKLSENEAKSDPVAKEFFFGTSTSVTLFIQRDQLDLDDTYDDNTKRRPITLLPHIGDVENRENPKSPF